MKLPAVLRVVLIHLSNGVHWLLALSKQLIIKCSWLDEIHEAPIKNYLGLAVFIINLLLMPSLRGRH